MSKTTRYILTAAIGDALPGSTVELTDAQAESPLYASRITQGGAARSIDDVEDELAQYLADGKAKVDTAVAGYLSEAEGKAAQIVSDAEGKAAELVKAGEAKAAEIVQAAQAEAMKLATAPKK